MVTTSRSNIHGRVRSCITEAKGTTVTDYSGRHLHEPYRHDAFDVLVVVHFAADGAAHMWRIPAQALVAHGVLATAEQKGKTFLIVHGPPGVSGPLKDGARSAWTRAFYCA